MKDASPVAPDIYYYPSLILRFPVLIRLVHWTNYIFQLRKWHVMKHWKKLLREETPHFIALDFGGGESQYIIPFAKQFPLATFYNIDHHASNISFIQKYPSLNVNGIKMNFEKEASPIKGNLALCVGVLHYIEQDEQAIQNIYDSLLPGGKFLLYTPIADSPFVKPKTSSYLHYDLIHEVKHKYTQESIQTKLTQKHFDILKTVTCYGYFGGLVHSILHALQSRIYYANWIIKIASAFCLFLFLPFLLLGMILDFYLLNKKGSGFLIIAQKRAE